MFKGLERNDYDTMMPTEAETLRRFEALVRKYSREIEQFLLKLTSNHHDAEELAQDVFVKAFRKLESLRESRAERRWLFTIAINHFNDWITTQKRQESRRVQSLEVEGPADPMDRPRLNAQARELDDVLKQTIAGLPERQRIVLLLHAAKGFDYAAIAEMLGITGDAVKMSLFHARERLRRRVERYLGREAGGEES